MQAKMMNIVDIHCHILPGVDDGPETMEDTLAVLKEACRQGVSRMVATPHFHPGRYAVPAAQVLRVLQEVRLSAAREGIDIQLDPGHECYYYSGLLEQIEAGNVLTMAGTNFVLIEFEPETPYSALTGAVRKMCGGGYRPILAHYERYECLRQRTDRLEELRNHGAFFQLNFDRLLDRGTLFHPNLWKKQLIEGYVDFLGSDTHGMAFRPLHAGQAVEWMLKNVPEETNDAILVRNVNMLRSRNH